MKIHVSFGHPKGIGLEVFLKSLKDQKHSIISKFILYCKKSELIEYLNSYNYSYNLSLNVLNVFNYQLNLIFHDENGPSSGHSLKLALENLNDEDVILTLPTSKDQLILNNQQTAGHTDYFRKYFSSSSILMCFANEYELIGLLTDHVPLREVPKILTAETIYQRSKIFINSLQEKYLYTISQIVFAGINPHAGEEGILGHEDQEISKAIKKLKNDFPDKKFRGPLSGDTLHTIEPFETLKIYAYHDQALSYFKGKYGHEGVNITAGLPFKRISVDHGTAFDLYAKDQADCQGSRYVIDYLLRRFA